MNAILEVAEATPLTPAQLLAQFPTGKRPKRPCIIPTLPDEPQVFPTLAHLAEAVARKLKGRVPVLVRGVGTYPGYDTFPVFSVHGMSPIGLHDRPCTATYCCSVAVQDTPAEDLSDAIGAAQARLAGADA